MPKLSPTMEVGTIQQWVKSPGDQIEAGDVIAEIETDKAARSFEYNDDGFLAKVMFNGVLEVANFRAMQFYGTVIVPSKNPQPKGNIYLGESFVEVIH